MLEVRNLNKIYKTKKGVRHHALKDVSLKFEETGMVFIQGKSGSGKSTLLNLLGGLDSYDSGEIIIKGKSSKDFKGRDFDSYRNTYLGFIFQEFYIMEDFTVEQNIGLALKLQHRKADKETIDDILRKVDLEGYGQRKPNELSGGQKQRVAIARALVKNPQVIMADEPTGQLDSATGRQIFQTLKKLSREKLVLVVSHDRESAEEYGDRIIELSDGRVISDVKKVSYGKNSGFVRTERYEYLKDSYIHIKNAKALTKQDMEEISKMLLEAEGEVFVSLNGGISAQLYSAQLYGSEGTKAESAFVETDKAQNNYKQYGPGDFKLRKSRLPLKEAFIMGASGLKRKRIRLAFTIILTVISLVLFGVSDAFACYDGVRALYDGLQKTGISRVGISTYKVMEYYGYPFEEDCSFSDDLVAAFEQKFGDYSFIKAYKYPYKDDVASFLFQDSNTGEKPLPMYNVPYYSLFFVRMRDNCIAVPDFSKVDFKFKTENSAKPQAAGEILITEYLASILVELSNLYDSMEEVVGSELTIGGAPLKIVGIVDIGLDDIEGLEELKKSNNELYPVLSSKLETEEMIYARAGITDLIKLDVLDVYGTYGSYSNNSNFIKPISFLNAEETDFAEGKSMESFGDGDVVADNYYLFAFYKEYYHIFFPEILGKIEQKMETDFNEEYEGEIGDDNYYGAQERFMNDNYPYYYETYFDGFAREFIDASFEQIMAQIETIDTGVEFELQLMKILRGNEFIKLATVGSTKLPQEEETIKQMFVSVLRTGLPRMTFYVPDSVYDQVIENELYKPGEVAFMFFYLSNNTARDMELLRFIDQNRCRDVTPISTQLDTIDVLAQVLKDVFFYVSMVLCVFAGLLLLNFISISVSYKKKEIGILRALGSRQVDVFCIFAFEALIIVAIEFVISAVGAYFFTGMLSAEMGRQFVELLKFDTVYTLFFFGIRQTLLMAALAVGVAVVASFIPVKKIASMKPINAIKDL
ncbi:MAG: ABC transporter ATP-binding protein/permease [Clostridiales bacterium]|nr:ABC transporter ATP-binding protein/permease [Clostridiales bacterium]